MNLLKTIIERLNQRVEVANIFDKQFGLCELNANGNEKAWVHYIGNGQAEVVTNFDAKQGTLFWAKRGKVTVNKTDAYKMSGCKQLYVTSFPLTAYAVVRKSHLPCDGDDAQDWLASRIYKLTSGTDPLFKQSIAVINYEVIPSGYINEIKTLTANYEWACVTVDFDVQVITTTEDGCYDICATGDIPLPDLQPCTPCLTEVAVDGVTIIGNGTTADPLVAVGGEGGAIAVDDEGVEVTPIATRLNFTGEGVTATLQSPGVVDVNVPGGGGAVGTLQEVTDLGNSTTNNIAFTASAGLSFDNGAFFRKGTTDAGNGGAKGTAQICSISYELKWEAGRLYYMEQDGFTIRDVTHNFALVPQVTDDSSKGFVVGSRWSLDDGTVYLCSDDTIGAAVWAVVTASVSNLQDVTDVGNTTTNDLIVQGANDFVGQVSSQTISAYNSVTNAYAEMFVGTSGQLTLSDGTSAGILSVNNLSNANVQLEFPNKTTGNYTIATTADIPSTIVESVGGTAPIASSGGANPDISITQADGSTDGYLTSTDWSTFNGKFDVPTGTSSDYLDGTGAPTVFPTLTNGTVTSVATTGLISGGTITTSGTISTSMATNKLVGRYSASTGIMEEVTIGSGLTLTGAGLLNNTATPTPLGYYGAWQDNNTQTAASSNVGYPLIFRTIDLENQVRVVTNGSQLTRITFDNTGIYNLQFSVQVQNTDNAQHDVTIWIRKNGVDVVGSAGFISVPARKSAGAGNEGHGVYGWNYLLSIVAGEYYEIVWSTSNSTHVTIQYYAAGSPPPSTASVIATVTQQSGIMAGTGITAINSLTGAAQTLIAGTSGTDFVVSSAGTTHTFNLPTASASNRGALSSADWSTFNGKVATSRSIGTTAPLSGGGDLTANRTLSIAKATASVDGYLAATDFTTFAAKQNAITPASLTKTDDTNVTLTLGGSPTTSLLAATSLTLGWTGTLADARIASATTWNAKQAALVSGTNIKTINSVSLLGSGDITTTYKSTTDTATITGVTNQLVGSQLIAANSFAVGDIIKILARYKKSTALVNSTIRFYVNSTNNLSGTPLLIGTYGLVGLYAQMERNLFIKSSTNTETFGNASSFYIDSGTGTAFSNSSIDWTINQYIIFAAQQGVAAETTLLTGYLIEKK